MVGWKRAIGGVAGECVERIARDWFDRTGRGCSTQRGAWDPTARLVDVNEDSIRTAVLFGSRRGVHAFTKGDVALGPVVAQHLHEDRLFWSCEMDESELPRAVETLGEGAIVFASDYPHWDCTFPGAVDALARRNDLSRTAKERIFSDNALRLYGARLGDGSQ